LTSRYEGELRVPNGTTVREDRYGGAQKQFGYALGLDANIFDSNGGEATFFSSGSNFLGQHLFQSNTMSPDELPGFLPLTTDMPPMDPNTTPVFAGTGTMLENPYATDFSIGGGSADNLFQPYELEPLLRRFDVDSNLISGRLGTFVLPASINDVTTNSFDISMPNVAVSLPQRLNAVLRRNDSTITQAEIATLVSALIPTEILRGGKLDLNRALGNGMDDDGDGVVDNETAAENTAQRGSPTLTAEYLASARHQLARDIYITMLLACGDRAPANFTVTTPTQTFPTSGTANEDNTTPLTAADREYRKLIAQYAVNLVDFRDADSIMTPFEFDIEPFDSRGWEVNGDLSDTMIDDPTGGGGMVPEEDVVVIWGAERAELLLTESFASHDRQTDDRSIGMGMVGTAAPDEDDDWDSVNAPITNAAFEIYSPWFSAAAGFAEGTYRIPSELANAAGDAIDLAKDVSNNPVWRIGLKRQRSELNTDILRTIYFDDDISGLPAAMDATGERFTPSAAPGATAEIAPGAYASIGGSTAIPFGALSMTLPTPILIDFPRELSISDLDGGYTNLDGTSVLGGAAFVPQPRDAPVDSHAAHGDEDFLAIWTNGITDNFRYAYLQRLANPLLVFDPVLNPYITVDSISVDLISRNSLSGDPDGHDLAELVLPNPSMPTDNTASPPFDGEYFLESTERGEAFLTRDPATGTITGGLDVARQNLFGSTDGEADEVRMAPAVYPTLISNSFGLLNEAYDDTAAPLRTPFGSLTWNNRPFASTAEIMNVPYLGGGLLPYFLNTGATVTASAPANMEYESYIGEIAPYFGDRGSGTSVYQHLLRFGGPLGAGVAGDPTANRFAQFFEFVEVPSRFLGSETYVEDTGSGYPAGFSPPFHYVPNFRVPGRVNINTVNNASVWNPVTGGLSPVTFDSGAMSLSGTGGTPIRDIQEGPSDVAGYFTSAEGRMFVPNITGATHLMPGKGSTGTLNQVDATTFVPVFDANAAPGKDQAGTAFFKNELRQRLSDMVTTKSSVFSIWITIGYFQVDEFGRVGAEIGSDEGNVNRDRAFYMIDRSIPVAFEPGKNHNIDQTVLLRSIIE